MATPLQNGVQGSARAASWLEIKMAKDKEKLWVGCNDVRGRYRDNHLGRGCRHEFDPRWLRIEAVRTIVD